MIKDTLQHAIVILSKAFSKSIKFMNRGRLDFRRFLESDPFPEQRLVIEPRIEVFVILWFVPL